MLLLGPSIELVENPGQLPASTAEPVAAAGVALQDVGLDQLLEPEGEDRRADAGPLPQLREGERAPAQLPDEPQRPAPPEQVKGAFDCLLGPPLIRISYFMPEEVGNLLLKS